MTRSICCFWPSATVAGPCRSRWVRVPHEGNSDLKLQQQLLKWFKACLPPGAPATIIADCEFYSIHLAAWIAARLGLVFCLADQGWHLGRVRGGVVSRGRLGVQGQNALLGVGQGDARPVGRGASTWSPSGTDDEEELWLLITNHTDPKQVREIYAARFWIEEMFSDHKSRGLNLESTRLTDPDRLECLLVAVTLAYLWIMEVGALVVRRHQWRRVYNRGAQPRVSLCQIGLRWLTEGLTQGFLPPLFTGCFRPLVET